MINFACGVASIVMACFMASEGLTKWTIVFSAGSILCTMAFCTELINNAIKQSKEQDHE